MKRLAAALALVALAGCADTQPPTQAQIDYQAKLVKAEQAEAEAKLEEHMAAGAVSKACEKDAASAGCVAGMMMLAGRQRQAPQMAQVPQPPAPPQSALQTIWNGAISLANPLLSTWVQWYGINRNTEATIAGQREAGETTRKLYDTFGNGLGKGGDTVTLGNNGVYLKAGNDATNTSGNSTAQPLIVKPEVIQPLVICPASGVSC